MEAVIPVMSYLQKYVFQIKKGIIVKAFNMITNRNEAKTLVKHISCNWKCKFNSTTCNSSQKGIMKHANVSVKIIVQAKKTTVGILAHASW